MHKYKPHVNDLLFSSLKLVGLPAYTVGFPKCVIHDSEARVNCKPNLINDKLISFYLCKFDLVP